MCALPPAWMWLLLGLFPLEIQSRALSLHSLTHRHRLHMPRTSNYQKSSLTSIMPTAPDFPVAFENHVLHGDRHITSRALLHIQPPYKMSDPFLDETGSAIQELAISRRKSRGRRHVHTGGTRGHNHLMRVGCVLGTCQVQNLSHRLYQLIGQSGRDDSSPINPRSPHSYG